MKIARKISISFFIMAIVLTSSASLFVYYSVRDILLRKIYTQLETTAEVNVQHIETYLDMLKVSLSQFTKSVVLEDYLNAYKENPSQSHKEFEIAVKRLVRTKEANPEIFEFLLLDNKGKIIASSNTGSIGKDLSADTLFVGAQKEFFIKDSYYQKDLNERLISVSAPMLDSGTGQFLGVLAARVRMDGIDKITAETRGLSSTGEVYIVNKYGYMITPSRFLEDTFLRKKVDTANYNASLLHKDKDIHELGDKYRISIAPDYRGVIVLGSHAYIPEMQWSLLAEIDEKEAFEPLMQINLILAAVLVLVPAAAYFLSAFFAGLISGPIHKLHKGTEIIGSGNLDYKVGTKAKDEIGQLSRAFDSMTDNLKQTTTSIENLNQEIAERKKAESALRESEVKYRTLYDSSADAIMLLDPKKGFFAANPATLKLFGCASEKEFIVFSPADLSPEFQPDGTPSSIKVGEVIAQALEKGSNLFEWVHKRLDGEEFSATVLLSRIELGNKIILQATVRDITAIKEAERQMRRAIAIKEEFTAMVSHELRTPLGPIKEGVRIILDGLTGNINEEQRDLLRTVERSADRLNRLINNVLDFQKLQAGKVAFNLQENDILELVNEVHQAMSLITKSKGIDFTVESDVGLPRFKFDRDRIMQVLNNLVNNAIKFTEGGIKVIVKKGDNVAHVIVKDSGPGISQEDMPKLFQSFHQLDLAKEKGLGGTGLGLAISKEIISQHNGKIWVESEPGQGAAFQFVLPIKERRV